MRIGKILRLAALTFTLAIAVTPALVEYARTPVAVAGEVGAECVAMVGGGHHGIRGGGGGRHYCRWRRT